jgi:PilZ domain-containing protein
MREEKRRHHRYPVIGELRGKALIPLEHVGHPSLTAAGDLRGVITDIGGGGLGLSPENTIDIAEPFVCWILVPELPIGIPTLLQVRWALKDGQGHAYRVGLQFLV